jgi:hypothetical protein
LPKKLIKYNSILITTSTNPQITMANLRLPILSIFLAIFLAISVAQVEAAGGSNAT